MLTNIEADEAIYANTELKTIKKWIKSLGGLTRISEQVDEAEVLFLTVELTPENPNDGDMLDSWHDNQIEQQILSLSKKNYIYCCTLTNTIVDDNTHRKVYLFARAAHIEGIG